MVSFFVVPLRLIAFSGLGILLCLVEFAADAQTNFSIYSDQLNNGFQNWSWGTNNFSSPSPVHSGTDAISFSSSAWDAVSVEHSDFNPVPYTNLTFWANGGTSGGQILQIYVQYGSSNGPAYQLSPLAANTWQFFNLSFGTLGVTGITNLNRINFQLTAAGATGSFSLDDISLVGVVPSVIHIGLDAQNTLRAADARWFGLNTAVWDNYFNSTSTSNALQEMGTKILRFPGGSLSDQYHWATGRTLNNTFSWATSFSDFMQIATNAGVQGMITVNYGTGTSNEAAAWVLSANITNHCSFTNWEIGNECYGSWETDSNGAPQDPYTYAVRAAGYITLMKQADPRIHIGVVAAPGINNYSNAYTPAHAVTNPRTHQKSYGWTPIVLATLKSLGVKPDFLIHHVYPEYGNDSDQALLQDASNWSSDAADLRQQITDYFGPTGTNIELVCTENNADSGNQGKQSTSIVNGLYLADSLSQLMKTEFNGFIWWDLRNGQDTSGDFSSLLYGWRTYGDLGIIGNSNTRYPTFYAFKLMQYLARPGDTVLSTASDYTLLSTYATRKADGSLAILIINKDSVDTLTGQITLTNFVPLASATVRSYGITQDEETRTNGPLPAQDIAVTSFSTASTNFTATFPPYSLTLFTLAPAAPQMQPGILAGGQYLFQLQGQSGVTYQIQSSTNLLTWTPNATITLSGNTGMVTNDASVNMRFWRAMWMP